ncbi:MAG TPA: hypothetical protein PLT50_04110, partial [bacterium]|nr:hypothetical protein [bacterium]
PIEDILLFISKDASSRDIDPVGVASLIDTRYMASSTQEMLRAKMGLDKMYFGTPYYKKRLFNSDYEILSYLSNKEISYVIVPSGEVGPDNLKHYEILSQIRDFILAQGNIWYEPIKTFNIVGDQVTVYRRNPLNKEFRVGTCRNFYEVPDGRLTLPMDPMASLIFFTSSFNYSGINKEGAPNTIQVLEINNPSMKRELRLVTVENLPLAFTVCHRMGMEVKVQKEFYIALLESENSCGINSCELLEHTKISDYSIEQNIYSSKDFWGIDPASRILKRIKVLPLYDETYTLENDIIKEFGYR